jgi:AraC family transcriptional regulator
LDDGGVIGQSKLMRRADPTQTAGSRSRSRNVAGFVIAGTQYRPLAAVTPHIHALAGLAFIVAGRNAKRFGRVEHDCRPGTMTFEAPGVEHAERYGREAVRALLIEMSAARFDMVSEIMPLRTAVCLEHAAPPTLAKRLLRELQSNDTASALAIEGLALELVAHAGRVVDRSAKVPSWLRLIVSRLRDECRQQLTVSDLAAEAGVHPAHVARVFRTRMGCSVGEFQRRLRVEWAMAQLQWSAASLDVIALEAGFFDQSHFCRVFRGQVGVSPGQFRRSVRPARDAPSPPSQAPHTF